MALPDGPSAVTGLREHHESVAPWLATWHRGMGGSVDRRACPRSVANVGPNQKARSTKKIPRPHLDQNQLHPKRRAPPELGQLHARQPAASRTSQPNSCYRCLRNLGRKTDPVLAGVANGT